MALIHDIRRRWRARSLERQEASGRSSGTILGAPRWAAVLVGLAVFALLYWGLLGWLLSDTSADLSLRPDPGTLPPGGSVTAAYAATLTLAELDRGGWTPNDSVLAPTAALTEMPAFQTGVHSVLSAAVAALAEETGSDLLEAAAEDYAAPPTRGFFNGAFPFMGGSAGARYRDGAEALTAYNNALATSEVLRPSSPADARALVRGIASALRPTMNELDAVIRGEAQPVDADELHARARGQAYAAALLLRGVRSDFDSVLRERQLGSALAEAVEQLDRVAVDDPLMIGRDDLTSQGYFLRSAREALGRTFAGLGA